MLGLKEDGLDDPEKLAQHRQTSLTFSTESTEISFNDYIEKIKQKE